MELLERHEPLSRLAEAAAAAGEGRSAVAVVRGGAGLGKTSLIRAFLDSQPLRNFVGLCDDSSVPTLLGPFRDILMADDASRAPLDVDEARIRLREVLADPGIVVIEDVHWADEASLDLIMHATRRMASASALLVLTVRDVDSPHLLRCLAQIPPDLSIDIELEPLSPSAVLALSEPLGRDADEVYADTGGNPFLVVEALAVPRGRVPSRVAYAASARLARLSPRARELATLVSVFPSGVDWEQLEELWIDAATSIEELEEGGLIEPSNAPVVFRHDLMRRAVENGLTVASRRRYNQLVLENLDPGSSEAAVLAHHAYEAGNTPLFVESAIVAARDFSRANAHRDALRHLERVAPHIDVLDTRQRAAFSESLGNELLENNRFSEAYDELHKAVDQWRRLGDLPSCARTLSMAASTTWYRGEPEKSLAEMSEALSLYEQSSRTVDILQTRVFIAQKVGILSRWPEALIELDKVVEEASGRYLEVEAIALGPRGNARRILGDLPGGSADETRAIELALELGLQRELKIGYANRVATSLGTLDLKGVEQQLDVALAHAIETESERARFRLLAQKARLDLLRGRWNEAIETSRQLRELDPEQSVSRHASVLAEGLIRIRRGDDTGMEFIQRANDQAATTRDIQRIGPVGIGLAELVWLGKRDDVDQIHAIGELACSSGHVRFIAELAVWTQRLGIEGLGPPVVGPVPLLAELAGDWEAAADAREELGCPYRRLLALGFSDAPGAIREAVNEAARLGAVTTADRLRLRLRELGHRVSRGRERTTLTNPGGLTRRQIDVVRLLAHDMTNQEIAEALYISQKTVDHHVSAILSRLGVADRRAAGQWALQHDVT